MMHEEKTLLLVDDDELFRDALARALQRNGFTVYKAADSNEGLELARQHTPGFGVIDLCIGSESGLQLIERLTERQPGIRLVVLTGYASISTAIEAIKLGAQHYLTKPADTREIIDALFADKGNADTPTLPQPMSVRKLEWEHIQKVLAEHDGNISASARALGMHRRTLQRKLQKRPVRD